MSQVDILLSQFVDDLNAGLQPDAREFIERAGSVEERKELALLIDQTLTTAPESATHPRDAKGAFISPVSRADIEATVDGAFAEPRGWDVAIPEWQSAAGVTDEQLAEQTVTVGGFATSDRNLSAARRWIVAMKNGEYSTSDISSAALTAVAKVLGVAADKLAWEGREDVEPGLAFRAKSIANHALIAESLDEISDVLGHAISEGPSEIDDWFER